MLQERNVSWFVSVQPAALVNENFNMKNMTTYYSKGELLRSQMKELVLSYMKDTPNCASISEGMNTAQLFRSCGFDWGSQENATSSNQQYYMVALLRKLEAEGEIQRDPISKKWRLK